MHEGNLVCYHSEIFQGGILNYTMHYKEIYDLFQDVKKWKKYIMGKETIIHIDHQTLQYVHAHRKLQQTRHYKSMRIL
jgi:hypothetical protein